MQFKLRYFHHYYRKKKYANYSKNRANVDRSLVIEILLPLERSAILQRNTRVRIYSILHEFEFRKKKNSHQWSVPIVTQHHNHIAHISSSTCLLLFLLLFYFRPNYVKK
jgi:hypothetical protein